MTEGVDLQNPSRYPLDADRLRRASRAVLDMRPERRDYRLSLVFADARTLHALNRKFRGTDAPTDALAFPAGSPAPGESGYLGDVIIAYDYAASRAEAGRLARGDVLSLLVIHGTLHLLGYDHDSPAAQERMWAAQASALRASAIDPAIVGLYGGVDDD